MTNANNGNSNNRLDQIETILVQIATQQLALTQQQTNTQYQLEMLADDVTRVLARDAILNDVLLGLRDSHDEHRQNFEAHQRNFEEHQRTTNVALQSLEAILLQLIRNFQ